MTQRPDLRGRLTFVQIGVPSRSDLESYAAIEAEIGQRIAAINARYARAGRRTGRVVLHHPARRRSAWSRSIVSPTSASSVRCTTG